jgi:TrmH family RNA methyltransferase
MIESEQNPKVKLARSLLRRREREREGLLFVEGVRLVEDALAQGNRPTYLFHTDEALTNPRIAALVSARRDVAWEVSRNVMEHMAETVSPQGIAAILPIPNLPWPPQPTLLLLMDRLRDPGNLGTLLRSAAAAGVEGVIVPKGSVDPWSDKVLRAGMGAHFRIPIRDRLEWPEIDGMLEGLTVYMADAAGELPYDKVDWTRPAALLVGGEARGAGEPATARITGAITIPMAGDVESLNAAVAGSIILFEARRQRLG